MDSIVSGLLANDYSSVVTEWSDFLKDQEGVAFLYPFINELESIFQILKVETKKCIHHLTDLELKKIIAQDVGRAIYPVISRPIIWEYTVYKKHSKQNKSFNEFVESLSENSSKEILKKKYPVMDTIVNRLLNNYLESQTEFLNRLANDHADILHSFRINTATLCGIKSAGDSHSGGRRTIIACFKDENNNDFLLIYKPRPIQLDKAFNHYLEYLGSKIGTDIFKPMRILDKVTHGWIEYIPRKSIEPNSIENYFERLGYLLCVIYSLNGSDIHFENLIANGEYPVAIDLECLFTTPKHDEGKNDIYWPHVDDTCIIPMSRSTRDLAQAFDVSAMKQEQGSVLNLKHFSIDGINENNPIAKRKESMIIPRDNVLEVVGSSKKINPNDHLKSFINGFRACYVMIESNKDDIVQHIKINFQNLVRRVLYRPTFIYDRLMKESYHPRLLSDQDEYNNYFSKFQENSPNPSNDKVFIFELIDMERGDIPCFFSKTDSKVIFDSNMNDTRLREDVISMERVIDKIRSMSSVDMQNQEKILRNSIGETYGKSKEIS